MEGNKRLTRTELKHFSVLQTAANVRLHNFLAIGCIESGEDTDVGEAYEGAEHQTLHAGDIDVLYTASGRVHGVCFSRRQKVGRDFIF